MGGLILKKGKAGKEPRYGLTKEELTEEIAHYQKLLKTKYLKAQPKTMNQIKFMLEQYQNGLTNFDNLDVNKDGRLDKSEVEEK